LDAFQWRVPLAGITTAAPTIEPEPSAVAGGSEENPPAIAGPAAAPPARRGAVREPKPAGVIPLVHAPDDPGPEAAEASGPPSEAQADGWRGHRFVCGWRDGG